MAIVIWAGTPIVTKIAVGSIDAVVVGILRTLLAAVVTVPILVLGRIARPASRTEVGLLVISALSGFVFFPLLFSLGLRYTSSSHAALILATLPLLTGLIAAVVERRAPLPRWWLGAAIALAGEVVLIGFRGGIGDAGDGLIGDLLVVLSCFGASLGYVAGGRLSRTLGTWPTTLWGVTLGGLVLAPALPFALAGVDWSAIDTSGMLSVAYLAFCSTILAYVAWYWALARGGIGRIGTLQFAQPIVSLALAVAILGEVLTLPLVLSAVGILVGIWVAQRS